MHHSFSVKSRPIKLASIGKITQYDELIKGELTY